MCSKFNPSKFDIGICFGSLTFDPTLTLVQAFKLKERFIWVDYSYFFLALFIQFQNPMLCKYYKLGT